MKKDCLSVCLSVQANQNSPLEIAAFPRMLTSQKVPRKVIEGGESESEINF